MTVPTSSKSCAVIRLLPSNLRGGAPAMKMPNFFFFVARPFRQFLSSDVCNESNEWV